MQELVEVCIQDQRFGRIQQNISVEHSHEFNEEDSMIESRQLHLTNI